MNAIDNMLKLIKKDEFKLVQYALEECKITSIEE